MTTPFSHRNPTINKMQRAAIPSHLDSHSDSDSDSDSDLDALQDSPNTMAGEQAPSLAALQNGNAARGHAAAQPIGAAFNSKKRPRTFSMDSNSIDLDVEAPNHLQPDTVLQDFVRLQRQRHSQIEADERLARQLQQEERQRLSDNQSSSGSSHSAAPPFGHSNQPSFENRRFHFPHRFSDPSVQVSPQSLNRHDMSQLQQGYGSLKRENAHKHLKANFPSRFLDASALYNESLLSQTPQADTTWNVDDGLSGIMGPAAGTTLSTNQGSTFQPFSGANLVSDFPNTFDFAPVDLTGLDNLAFQEPLSAGSTLSDSFQEITPDQFQPSSRTLARTTGDQNSYTPPFPSYMNNQSSSQPQFAFGAGTSNLQQYVHTIGSTIGSTIHHAFTDLVSMGVTALGTRENPFDLDSYIPRLPLAPPPPPPMSRDHRETMALIKNINPNENIPKEDRVGTPEAMASELMEHQKVGLTWMIRQETKSTNKGGILADDMGLGKTIQAIALMLSNKSKDSTNKTTLIIATVSLLNQWESELREKVKQGHQFSIHRFHDKGRRFTYEQLQEYDVVLTTYGTVAADYKKKVEFQKELALNPQATQPEKLITHLIDTNHQWYRVILDESQNIKNDQAMCTKAAFQLNATYRWCMTGTPMMNTVYELWPLIHFCGIKPYSEKTKFSSEIGRAIAPDRVSYQRGPGGQKVLEVAMQKLQALLAATMLRRTKKSMLDGKPILDLPERIVRADPVEFDDEEKEFYDNLQRTTQVQFRKLLSGNTLGRQYSHALVLLLRLRQACCHRDLVLFHENMNSQSWLQDDEEKLRAHAKLLNPEVVARIKLENGEFQCPICLDGADNPAILPPCGHLSCSECFTRLCDNTAQAAGTESGSVSQMKCPVCRGSVNPKVVTDFVSFKKLYQPELLTAEERDEDSETADESSESEEENDDPTLGGFIVPDEDDLKFLDANLLKTSDGRDKGKGPLKKKDKKMDGKKRARNDKRLAKSKARAIAKASDKHERLALLKKASIGNKQGKRLFMEELDRDYTYSAKIKRMMQLIEEIGTRNPKEKILVFSQFTTLLDYTEIPLMRHNIEYVRYDGSMTANERFRATDEFRMNDSVRVMIVSLKAGNSGLNLNVANHVIILDPFWNPYIEEQAIDRAHRIGQMRDVQVYRIVVHGTVEDRILHMQEEKRQVISRALDEDDMREMGRLGQRELQYLFGM